jgi:hypothetical protein
MMLFSTTTELKEYISLSGDMDFNSLRPSLKQAARKRITSVIGPEVAASLVTYYNGGNPDTATDSAKKYALLQLTQEALAYFGLEAYVPEGNVMVSGQGINVQESEHSKAAEWWHVKDLIRKYAKAGEEALEEVLIYLEKEDPFENWVDSDARSELKTLHIQSATDFQKYFNIGSNRSTFLGLQAIIRDVQNMYLEPTLSQEILDLFLAYNPESSAEEKRADDLLKHALANITIGRACRTNLFEVNADGFKKRSTSTNNSFIDKLSDASREELNRVELETMKTGNAYLQKLTDYLNTKAIATVFAEWKASDKYIDPSTEVDKPAVIGEGGIISF